MAAILDHTAPHTAPAQRAAVVLNANAKKVTRSVKARVEAVRGDVDVYYSTSLEEGRQIAQTILDRGYSTVLTGGGDGTLIQFIQNLFELTGRATDSRGREGRHLQAVPGSRAPLPTLGILKLGTGNALAGLLGASRYDQDVQKLRKLVDEGQEPNRWTMPLMEAEGKIFPFAGLGWDAAILNDYNQLKDLASNPVSKAVVKSVLGYLVAALGMTAPRVAIQRSAEVEVRALGEAVKLGPKGEVVARFSRGDVLYRGPANMVGFSTEPYYGYRFEMFPHAWGLTDRFQLRIAAPSLPETVAHLVGFWRGTYRSPRVHDFLCEKITMSFSRPVPYQLGGDAMGTREGITVGMSPWTVDMLHHGGPLTTSR